MDTFSKEKKESGENVEEEKQENDEENSLLRIVLQQQKEIQKRRRSIVKAIIKQNKEVDTYKTGNKVGKLLHKDDTEDDPEHAYAHGSAAVEILQFQAILREQQEMHSQNVKRAAKLDALESQIREMTASTGLTSNHTTTGKKKKLLPSKKKKSSNAYDGDRFQRLENAIVAMEKRMQLLESKNTHE